MDLDVPTIIQQYESEILIKEGLISQGRSVVVYNLDHFSPNDIFKMACKYHKLLVKVPISMLENFIIPTSEIHIDKNYIHVQGKKNEVQLAIEKYVRVKNLPFDLDFCCIQNSISNDYYLQVKELYIESNLTPLPITFFLNQILAVFL